ncbi:hypothetical protein BDR06DRAFT_1003574 [Suillus hirtellus]|nr:hypothetical protein BDR06DRAFT_1003574 [Suillus hirtellus]
MPMTAAAGVILAALAVLVIIADWPQLVHDWLSSEKSLKATIKDISDSEDADYTPPNLDDHNDIEYYESLEEAATEAERARANTTCASLLDCRHSS